MDGPSDETCRAHGAIPDPYWGVFRHANVWAGAAGDAIDALAGLTRVREYARGEMLALEGSDPEHAFIVLSGHLRLITYDECGQVIVLETLEPGQSIGAIAACIEQPLMGSVQACDEVVVATVPRSSVAALFLSDPAVATSIARAIAKRFERMVGVLKRNAASVPRRLAMYLCELPIEDYDERSRAVHLPFARNILAEMLSTSPETLSRTFRSLQEQGVIESRDRVVVMLDECALRHLAEAADA